MTTEMDIIMAAKAQHEKWLGEQPGCGGIGVGVDASSNPCITIYSQQMTSTVRNSIESRLVGLNVEFVELGTVRKQ